MATQDTDSEKIDLARERILKLLSVRARSSGELRDRLIREGHDAESVDGALNRLERVGLVNDCEFARNYVRSLMVRKPSGKAGLLFRLRKYKVDATIARDAIEEAYSDSSEEELARDILDDRYPGLERLEYEVAARRIASLLKRRGFGPPAISSVLEELRRRRRVEEHS
jgi:regulatory protein